MIYPEIKPLNASKPYLVVLVHGVGSNGDDLIDMVPPIQYDLPNCHFISPHGVEPYDMAPVGRQWFSLRDRNLDVLSSLLENAAAQLEKIIKHKQEQLNLTNANTILVGFSQGTMLSLRLTLSVDTPFLACVGFAGALIPPSNCSNKNTEICLIHGIEDDVIPILAFDKAQEYLENEKIPYIGHKIKNLKHSINNTAIDIALEFIKNKVK